MKATHVTTESGNRLEQNQKSNFRLALKKGRVAVTPRERSEFGRMKTASKIAFRKTGKRELTT